MEINSLNCQEIQWTREMLRQGTVIAQQTTATYIEVVIRHIFYSIRYVYRFLTCQKTVPKTDSLYRCARLTAYRCTRQKYTGKFLRTQSILMIVNCVCLDSRSCILDVPKQISFLQI